MSDYSDEALIATSTHVLEDIQLVAETPVAVSTGSPGDVLATDVNPLLNGSKAAASDHLAKIQFANHQALQSLRTEPFVSRVAVCTEDGREKVFYFCRGTPPSESSARHGKLASYRSPLGRLAEYEPGDEVEIEIRRTPHTYRIIERLDITPARDGTGWDAVNARAFVGSSRRSIASLRRLLESLQPKIEPAVLDDLFAQLAQEDRDRVAKEAAAEGFRHEARRSLSLRDQATLDHYQGDVFRLPLDRRIMLSGPPGTGKTTTLIKRLGQKLDPTFWGEAEQDLLPVLAGVHRTWVMFSPTDLLKLYLKEAFAREQIAASEQHVKTWDDERLRLSRDVLGILQSPRTPAGGQFVLKRDSRLLANETSPGVWELYESFQDFVSGEALTRYRQTFDFLLALKLENRVRDIVREMQKRAGDQALDFRHLYDIIELQDQLSKPILDLGAAIEKLLRDIVNKLHSGNPALVEQIGTQAESLLSGGTAASEDDEADEPNESTTATVNAKKRGASLLLRTVRSMAREAARGGALKSSAKYFKIAQLLGDARPSDEELRQLGEMIAMRRELTFLSETHRNLVERLPESFQRFRRRALADGKFYRPEARERVPRNEISEAELDVVILTMLRSARVITARPESRRWRSNTPLAILEAIEGEYRMQVLVDEATDFSAVQLGCMLGLSHPTFSSLFASGDLRQRMTTTGIRSHEELNKIGGDFEVRELSMGYRQSRLLTRLAQDIAALMPGSPAVVNAYYDEQPGDVPPILLERAGAEELEAWLVARIEEICSALRMLPSIAIFVSDDEAIQPLVDAISPRLNDASLFVRACPGGRDVGNENEIRVFSAQYIKGLEFEAVFFLGVDDIAQKYAELFTQILYVGATRATRYLGVSCVELLPEQIAGLRTHFRGGSFASTT